MSTGSTVMTTADLIRDGMLAIGDGYRAKNSELSDRGIPFARAGNIDGGLDFSGADRFPVEALPRVGEKVSRPGDIVFTSKGTVGRFAFVREVDPRFVYSPQLSYWRSLRRDRLDPKYLYYWLQGREFWLQAAGVKGQTDMADYVSLTDQRRMRITVPAISVQRGIGRTLSALDDKIDLNRETSRTLEAMAHAIFRSWFVDFDPVVAKSEGREPVGMGAETAALFPNRLVDSELGAIPEGWKVGCVGDLFDVVAGQSPPGSTYNELGEGEPFYQGRRDFSARFPMRRVYCTAPSRFAEEGDTLVSVRAPVGDANVATERCCIGRGVAAVRSRLGAQSHAYYSMLKLSPEFSVFEGSGSVFGSISQKDFKAIQVLCPDDEVILVFDRLVGPLDRLYRSNWDESQTLAALRDLLLPKLLSGEIRVPEAAEMVEDVA